MVPPVFYCIIIPFIVVIHLSVLFITISGAKENVIMLPRYISSPIITSFI